MAINIALAEGKAIAKATAEGQIVAKAITADKIIPQFLGQFNVNIFEHSSSKGLQILTLF